MSRLSLMAAKSRLLQLWNERGSGALCRTGSKNSLLLVLITRYTICSYRARNSLCDNCVYTSIARCKRLREIKSSRSEQQIAPPRFLKACAGRKAILSCGLSNSVPAVHRRAESTSTPADGKREDVDKRAVSSKYFGFMISSFSTLKSCF